MTKIYEALMNAQQEKTVVKPLSVVIPKDESVLHLPAENIVENMSRLNHSLEALLPNLANRVIQFVGSKESEGSSVLIREFAKVSAEKFRKSVLLVDTESLLLNQRNFFNVSTKYGCGDIVDDFMSIHQVVKQIGQSSLYVGYLGRNAEESVPFYNSSQLEKVIEALRKEFDLVLLDSPSISKFPDSLQLSPKADGVVLVVEAEKTRWQVADKVKEKINEYGGTILGAILNNRQHHIPLMIYKRISND